MSLGGKRQQSALTEHGIAVSYPSRQHGADAITFESPHAIDDAGHGGRQQDGHHTAVLTRQAGEGVVENQDAASLGNLFKQLTNRTRTCYQTSPGEQLLHTGRAATLQTS